MNILTKQHLIDVVCDRWLKQYYYNGEWRYGYNKEDTYYKLQSLGDKKTEESITEVIGNSSWTQLICNECNRDNERVVVMSCEEYSLYLCLKCINKAGKLLKGKVVIK
ncbi:TPA: hypothetical protein PNO69_004522 [Salmonella enterica]|nr:hypothetical protein [Salmonella enterica]HCH9607965.1 hypothetical protein [Salmonella enterica]HDI5000259.1 hypothetical protein [Salmonella enterica]HDI5005080.1 hypothetical protein [Salmonella enterica]